jgi:hypothetical protein
VTDHPSQDAWPKRSFIQLTPLVIIASSAWLPRCSRLREEEPQIIVPSRLSPYARRVTDRNRAARRPSPERLLWEIARRRYHNSHGQTMIVARFLVDRTKSVRSSGSQKLAANAAAHPARRRAASRETAIDRQRAGDGADALGRRIRR